MHVRHALERTLEEFKHDSPLFLGYPCNTDFDYSELAPFLDYAINNIGDPFAPSNFHINTHKFEMDVIDWYKKFFNAPMNTTWGYCNNGGTEGNMYSMYLASQNFPEATIYYSDQAHYSVSKAAKMTGLPVVQVPTDHSGVMLYGALREELKNSDSAAIVFANVGTTFSGGIDDVERIKIMLEELKYNDHYIHVDAALFGSFLPFKDEHAFDFRYGINSLSISGHKFLGMPMPSGICIVTEEDTIAVQEEISYIRTYDRTMSGSRNGITPLMFWVSIQRLARGGMQEKWEKSMATAGRALDCFHKNGIPAWSNEDSPVVVFPLNGCKRELISKYQIATSGDEGHICCMPGTDIDVITRFVNKMARGE
jgi:histidine decarboxylase